MKHAHTLTGLVLCGGRSTRMGSDKGLLIRDGKTWAEHTFYLLNDLDLQVKISINSTQKEAYQPLFNSTFFIEDTVEIPGPLAGLLSAQQRLGNQDLLIVACDMINITPPLLQQLIQTYEKAKSHSDFFVFKNEQEYEPMPGIYTNRGLQKVYDRFIQGQLPKFSMKSVLENGATCSIPISSLQTAYFRNYNSKDDF